MPDSLLILEDIHASYVKKEILRGVSFEVRAGEFVALLGGNGSGKSTTLKVIAGLLQPTRGKVWFRGKDITTASPQQRQRMGIGYLLQGGRIFPNLSVDENLRIAKAHARPGLKASSGAKAVGAIFPELAARRLTRAGLLSGGQRQMLSIEMVLAQEPVLALLDEPSSALAASVAAAFIHRFARDLAAETQRACLLVEQNQAAARETSAILHLENGVLKPTIKTTGILNL